MKHLLLLIIFSIFFSINGNATHITGSTIEYNHIGNDEYIVKVTLRRDGSPGNAAFPTTVDLNTHNLSGFVNQNAFSFTRDTIIIFSAVNPNDTCNYSFQKDIELAEYTDTISLPNNPGVYISYNVCCRPGNILNVVYPLNTTSSVYTFIPPASSTVNSSAQWNSEPPIYLTMGEPLTVDFSASDADGDSLVYSLYHPFDDYSGFDNQQNIPDNLLFNTINWENGFTELQPFDYNTPTVDSVWLDSETGILSGIAPNIGSYVFGVRCDEYRNGIKINTILRDITIDVASLFYTDFTATQTCSNEVELINESSAPGDSCVWIFGDGSPNLTAAISDTVNHIFPSNNTTYNIQLITSQGTACADTFEQTVFIDSTFFNLISVDTVCITDSVHLDYSYNGTGTVDSISWSFNQNTSFSSFGDTTLLLNSGVNLINAELINSSGCSLFGQDSVVVMETPQVDIRFEIDSSSLMDTLYLDLDTSFASYIEWSSPTNGSFINSINDAQVNYVLSSNELQDSLLDLYVSAENAYCLATMDSITFNFHNNFLITVNKLLGFDVSFTNTVQPLQPITDWNWDLDDGSTANVPNPTHTYTNPGYYDVMLHAFNDFEHFISTKSIFLDDASVSEDDLPFPYIIKDQKEAVRIECKTANTTDLMVINSLGKIVLNETFQSSTVIGKNRLSAGIYRLILINDENTMFVRSISVK